MADYQSITHISKAFGPRTLHKKEACEQELNRIDQSLKELEKQAIFVDMRV